MCACDFIATALGFKRKEIAELLMKETHNTSRLHPSQNLKEEEK